MSLASKVDLADTTLATPATIAGQLAHYIAPLPPDAPCDIAQDLFLSDSRLLLLPIVDAAGRPVGLLNRFHFLERRSAQFSRAGAGSHPVSALMDTAPLVLDANTTIDELGKVLVSRQRHSIFDGFIVASAGVYGGVATGVDLVRALTERRHVELERLAHHDMLTGLANRHLFDQRLDKALADAGSRDKVAVLFINLDHFKEVNDSYGHRYGDVVLCSVGQRMRGALRRSDIVARLSGDEFGIVLAGVGSAADAEAVARVLVASAAAPLVIDDREVIVSCSVGVAVYPDDATTREALVRAADTAQFRAKELRNSWQRYTTDMEQWRASTPGIAALRQALETSALHVHYQPIAELVSGRVRGVEALVRWTHPQLGAVAAADIVRLAEDSGLIVPLSEFVIRAAIRQMQRWDEETGRTDLSLAVNISAMQIHEGRLLTMLDQLIAESGFAPHRLEIELTEGTAMRASASAISTLHALKARGFALTIDDFGTGYSALSRLERLPIDAMKIDKSFLEGIGTDGRGGVIARAIIAMGHSLGLRLVGEGVETHQQMSFLRKEGCDCVQGYLVGPPLPAADVTPLLAEPRRDPGVNVR